MSIWEVIILGILQGLTEFLPISSSGHLVIAQQLFGISSENLVLEVVVHCGTLLSVVLVFWADIKGLVLGLGHGLSHWQEAARSDRYFQLLLYLIIGTIPAVIAGLLWKEQLEAVFHSVKLVGLTLMFTGLFLGLTYFVKQAGRQPNWWRSLIIGLAQALAILPGISRSGATIAAGLFLGLQRAEATRFSFLLSLPAILGALVLHLKDLMVPGVTGLSWPGIGAGLITSCVVGYLAIRFLLRIVSSGKLAYFAPYCLTVGALVCLFLA